jgi:hypothetical protein
MAVMKDRIAAGYQPHHPGDLGAWAGMLALMCRLGIEAA